MLNFITAKSTTVLPHSRFAFSLRATSSSSLKSHFRTSIVYWNRQKQYLLLRLRFLRASLVAHTQPRDSRKECRLPVRCQRRPAKIQTQPEVGNPQVLAGRRLSWAGQNGLANLKTERPQLSHGAWNVADLLVRSRCPTGDGPRRTTAFPCEGTC